MRWATNHMPAPCANEHDCRIAGRRLMGYIPPTQGAEQRLMPWAKLLRALIALSLSLVSGRACAESGRPEAGLGLRRPDQSVVYCLGIDRGRIHVIRPFSAPVV